VVFAAPWRTSGVRQENGRSLTPGLRCSDPLCSVAETTCCSRHGSHWHLADCREWPLLAFDLGARSEGLEPPTF
jgi:hypothetical protein